MNIYARLLLSSFILLAIGCGVKGNPQAPIEPPVLGRGQMNPVKSKPDNSKKKKFKSIEPDWEESDDFEDKKR